MNSAQILSKWSTVSLPSLQKLLDSQSLEIFSTQQTSLTSRRRLATLTKDFKKLENPNLLDFKTLLKEYQNEIDLINKRAKQVETWFIDIYKILVELPDPVNSLQELIEIEEKIKTETGVQVRNAELGKTVKVLSEEVERLRIVEEEKGLLVEKLRDLEGRVTHHSNSKVDGLVYEKSQLLLTDLQAELSQALLDHKETESALNRQISHLQSQFVTLQSSLSLTNATTLVEVKGNAEVEVLSEQVERLKEKLSSLSSQNFNLKEQIKVLQDESGSRLLKEGFEREKEGLRKDLEGVREEMEKVQIDKVKVVEDFKKTVSGLERQIGKLNTEVARLSTLLLEYSDYEQVKKELEIFKNMEGGYDDEDGHGNSGNVPLERIVLEKNKKLVNENTSLWNECELLKEELTSTRQEISTISEALKTKTNLISKLEKDIQQLNDLRANTSPSENLEMLMSPVKQPTDSIVPILTSQRDRYRQRFEQSQRTIQELSAKLTSTQDQLSRLQQDNVSLYEKLRYQESYRGSTTVTMDDVSTRYRDKYESTIDPFRHFKQEETKRASNLSPTDRLALQVTKILTANKYTRLVFVIYAGLLHILVFFALFEMMGSSPTVTNLPFPNKPDS